MVLAYVPCLSFPCTLCIHPGQYQLTRPYDPPLTIQDAYPPPFHGNFEEQGWGMWTVIVQEGPSPETPSRSQRVVAVEFFGGLVTRRVAVCSVLCAHAV